MHPSSILIAALAFFVTATTSLPQNNACTGDKTIVGYCNITSITDVTTSAAGPPAVSQCLQTCRSILTDAGDWIVDFTGRPDDFVDNMVLNPCGFGVGRGAGEPRDFSFSMHNQDIVDILDEVNQQFGGLHGGSVAAQGTMVCEGHQAVWYVN